MVASLVGMAQQPGISSAVGEPVEPTNKLWEKKMYLGAKKVSIFSKKTLTNRILPIQSLTEHRTQNTEHGIQHNSIYRANTLFHTSEAAGGISVCGLAAFKSFSPSYFTRQLAREKIKFYKGGF